jgi:hypothetical protein
VSAASAVPHSPQNFTAGGLGAPHVGHARARALPHSPQNLRPASFAVPQDAQTRLSATNRLYSARQESPSPGRATLPCVASRTHEPELSPDRAWWLRVPAVLLSPRSVFFALREEDPDDVAARSEPILLLLWLAGTAVVLASSTAGAILDDPDYDVLLLAIWAFVAGGIYGVVGYLVFGFALFFGARLFGTLGDFRRERQIVAFAAVPLAVSLLVLLPLRLALYGEDTFRAGGADEGAGEIVLLALQLVFVGWSLALLLVGVRVVHGWSWWRSAGAIAAGAALLAGIVGLFATL